MAKKYTKKETDFWGNEKEVHYEDGKKVGETRFRETFWGNKVQDHYDASGNKIGETRKEEGLFGDKAVHYDADKNKIGYTKDDKTFFGNKIQRHYDKSGKQVGKSHYEEGIFGGHKKVHEGRYFKAGKEDSKEIASVNYTAYDSTSYSSDSSKVTQGNSSFTWWHSLFILIAISLISAVVYAVVYWGPLVVLENIAALIVSIIALVIVIALVIWVLYVMIPFFIGAGGVYLIKEEYPALGMIVILIAIGVGAAIYSD